MLNDEIVYGCILILSVIIGFPLRSLASSTTKQFSTGLIGFTLTFGICGWDSAHSLITFIGNLLIIKFNRRHTSLLSFLWCFVYLLFFRCATYFSLSQPISLVNGMHLVLTLKLVSLAIEIHDYRIQKQSEEDSQSNLAKFQLGLEDEPSIFSMFCYTYCYTGLFTGPFFKYRTYYDYLHMKPEITKMVDWEIEIKSRLKQLALFAPLYVCVSYFFNIDYPKTDEFYNNPLWYIVFYMVPVFFIGRMRYYSAWLVAECSFISLTLGAYDKKLSPRPGNGPTINPSKMEEASNDYSFETIQNINPYQCEVSPTVRLGMRNWNMGVQWWLANYIYRRWPKSLSQMRIPAVMAVSAYWHGIYPGFFGAFLTMPLVMAAEDMLASLIKKQLSASQQKYYECFSWFAKMRAFEYMYMAFVLLSWHDTYRYWKASYFWLHISSVVIIISCLVFKIIFPQKKTKVQ